MCPASSRRPISTATRAVASAAASSRTRADRKATRSAAIVADRWSSVTFLMISAWALARPKIFSVGSPSTTSRKCPPSAASRCHWRCVRALVCKPTRTANRGMSGSVPAITSPDSQSAAVTLTSTASGTSTPSTSPGRYRAKYGSSASRPLVASVAISPGCCPVSHAGPRRSECATSRRRSCDLTTAAARSAAASPPNATSARASRTAARATIVPRSALKPVPRAAPASACASRLACASTSAVVPQPRHRVRTR